MTTSAGEVLSGAKSRWPSAVRSLPAWLLQSWSVFQSLAGPKMPPWPFLHDESPSRTRRIMPLSTESTIGVVPSCASGETSPASATAPAGW